MKFCSTMHSAHSHPKLSYSSYYKKVRSKMNNCLGISLWVCVEQMSKEKYTHTHKLKYHNITI